MRVCTKRCPQIWRTGLPCAMGQRPLLFHEAHTFAYRPTLVFRSPNFWVMEPEQNESYKLLLALLGIRTDSNLRTDKHKKHANSLHKRTPIGKFWVLK